jgi:cysteine-rich repeat protein
MFRFKKKSRNINTQIYRVGTSLTLGALFVYSQTEGSTQPYYDGRHWFHYQATTFNPSEAFNSPMSSFTVGKWHQLGEFLPCTPSFLSTCLQHLTSLPVSVFTTDLNRRTIWVDGFPMVAAPYYRGSRTLSTNEELFQLGNSNGAIIAEISDFRFYQRELSREEISNISKEWIDYHKGCGDGERDLDEDCDDGNRLNGDGCSGDCLM